MNEEYNLFIVGVGATGSNLLSHISQYAINNPRINKIVLIDGDTVEEKNFKNQKFNKRDINKNKAECLALRYSKLDIDISYIDRYLENKEQLINAITKSHKSGYRTTIPIIISCVDNNNARIILNDVFNEINTLFYIDVGNGDIDNRNGQIVLGAKSNNKIISNPVATLYPEILKGDPIKKETASCAAIAVEKPQFIATNVMSACTTFVMLTNLISFNKVDGTYYNFSAEKLSITKII